MNGSHAVRDTPALRRGVRASIVVVILVVVVAVVTTATAAAATADKRDASSLVEARANIN